MKSAAIHTLALILILGVIVRAWIDHRNDNLR